MSLNLLKTYQRLSGLPGGKTIFSWLFSLNAPYFGTIRPLVQELSPGMSVVTMKQRWSVQNHIKTIHAIAVCNLVEMSMGLVAEASIPSHLRWLPMGMDVQYLKKATGTLTATTRIDANSFFDLPVYPGSVIVPVAVTNAEGVVITKADVKLWISKKPELKK